MSGSLNKVAAMYLEDMQSIPQIASVLGIPRSRVRKLLITGGVFLRSRADGLRLRKDVLGQHNKGKKRQFTQEWKDNIRAARIRHGEKNAAGVSHRANGYIQFTRGENKHRSVHVVVMEGILGRRLLAGECVHHIDGNRSNNHPNNLALINRSGHTRLHRREQRLMTKEIPHHGRIS